MNQENHDTILKALRARREQAQEELRITRQKEKIITHQLNSLTRKARTHRLCARGAMLEAFLPQPELLTEEEILEILRTAFHTEAAQLALKKLTEELDGRESLAE